MAERRLFKQEEDREQLKEVLQKLDYLAANNYDHYKAIVEHDSLMAPQNK